MCTGAIKACVVCTLFRDFVQVQGLLAGLMGVFTCSVFIYWCILPILVRTCVMSCAYVCVCVPSRSSNGLSVSAG